MSPEEVHCRTGQWTLSTLAKQKRLNFVSGLAGKECDTLWGIVQLEEGWGQQFRADCQWLMDWAEGRWPSPEPAAWLQWREIFTARPLWFKQQVQKAADRCHADMLDKGGVQCFFRDLLKKVSPRRQLPAERAAIDGGERWLCMPCKRYFGSKSALAAHFFRKHHRTAAYRRYATGHVCVACGKDFFANFRLQAHLRMSPGCCAMLAAKGLGTDQVGPGEGSKAWQEDRQEHFILCPPTSLQAPSSAEGKPDRRWDEVPDMRRAYLSVSCAVLDFQPASGVDLNEEIGRVLQEFALFPEEVSMVLQRTTDEAAEIVGLHELPWGDYTADVLRGLHNCNVNPQLLMPGDTDGDNGIHFSHGSELLMTDWFTVCNLFPTPRKSLRTLFIDDDGQGTSASVSEDVVVQTHEAIRLWSQQKWHDYRIVLALKGGLEGEELLWARGPVSSPLAKARSSSSRQLLLCCWEHASTGGEIVITTSCDMWSKEALKPFRALASRFACV